MQSSEKKFLKILTCVSLVETGRDVNIICYVKNECTVKPCVATDKHFELDEIWRKSLYLYS